MNKINRTVLMSDASHFGDEDAINAYMDAAVPVDTNLANHEHDNIRASLINAGIKVIRVPSPYKCQDGVYTANWALCRNDKALLSNLPNTRKAESPYAEKILIENGKNILKLPENVRFSGQGDALPCGDYLFTGSMYRTDKEAYELITELLGYKVIGLQTIPLKKWGKFGPVIQNSVTGWPDSYFYDIDLALSVISEETIAYCPEAFTHESQKILEKLPHRKIIVNRYEAMKGFACNLISTGETVIMSANAPLLKRDIEKIGLKTITPQVTELGKGGGYIRCTSLTLDNS